MAAATNISATIQVNYSIAETVTSGLIVSQSLPASVTASKSYINGNSGASNVDLAYGKQLSLSATPTTLDLLTPTLLDGTSSTSFARVREFFVQNIGSAAVKVYANSTSGVTWLPSGSTSALQVLNGTSTSASAVGGQLCLSDPWVVGASSGLLVGASASKIVFDPGSGSTSVNVIVVGTSTAS